MNPKKANIGHHNKLQRKIFEFRIRRTLKKCTNAELTIVLIESDKEYNRRFRKVN